MEKKKEEEFNLSESIFPMPTNPQASNFIDMLTLDDVKEFIRLLKEGIHDFNETELGDMGRNNFIDKLAGEKLI